MADPFLIKQREAKKTTLFAMIFSACWIGGLSIAKGILYIFNKEFLAMNDIILSGVAIAGVFSPVFLSIWLDKIKEIREVAFPKEDK